MIIKGILSGSFISDVDEDGIKLFLIETIALVFKYSTIS